MSNERRLPDWIDSFLKFVENTEPPNSFKTWVAVSTVAACLKRKCVLEWGSLRFYPNMYVVLVGPSGTRKGTAMSPGLELLSSVGVRPAANSTTRQQLIRALRKANETEVDPETGRMDIHSSMTIFSTELTVFLGYRNLELMTDLIDWYDCADNWRYETKHDMGGGNVDDVQGVWVNIIGGTTPDLIVASMPREAIGFGLTARIIFVYEQRRGKTVDFPTYEEELRQPLIEDLERIRMLKGEYKVSPEVMDMWVDWRRECDNNPPFDDTNFGGYIERRPMHAMKLAMICNSSRTDSMVINADDFTKAKSILRNIEPKMPYTFSGLGRSQFSGVISQVQTEVAIKGEISFKELMARFYNDVDKFGLEKIVETLDAMDFIEVVTSGRERIIKLKGKPL